MADDSKDASAGDVSGQPADHPVAPVDTGAGVDPLIAHPLQSSGHTGEIARPGDYTPVWFVPALFDVFAAFIARLVAIGQTDRNEDVSAPSPDVAAVAGSVFESPTSAADEGVGTVSAADSVDELPPAGSVRVGNDVFTMAARCEVQLPLAPADNERQVSSYVFFDDTGTPQLIDQIFDDGSDTAQYTGAQHRFNSIVDIGDTGSFGIADGDTLTEPAAEVITDAGTFSASGFVTRSRTELDITIDLAAPGEGARRCTDADRL